MSLTLFPPDPILDLDPWVGQRQCTWKFHLVDGVTGENRGEIHPLRGASLSHDTSRTIKRQLQLTLGKEDTAYVNPIRDRILLTQVFPNGQTYPLGRYMFTDMSRQVYTSGKIAQVALNDEMFLVDQESPVGISGGEGFGSGVEELIAKVLEGLPVTFRLESSGQPSVASWSAGTARGSMLESLAVTGDYFSPWFDNNGVMRFIRSFNPADKIPDLDWDQGNQVIRANIVETDDLLIAPNTFLVVSNSPDETSSPITAIASVPPSAPNSIANRGFMILEQQDLQLASDAQAEAVVTNLVNRQTIFERVTLTTPPDPRHDSYNVVRWQGELWLELGWSMSLVEGGEMNHLIRKGYTAS